MIGYTIRHRVRFVKYTGLGIVAFSVDLSLLFLLQSILAVTYWIAVPLAFISATTLHYTLLRALVYRDSIRTLSTGYALFLSIMCANAFIITLLVSGLVEYTTLTLYPARILVGTLFGLVSFFLNSRYNFKVL
jgi:putative flippase GtrA